MSDFDQKLTEAWGHRGNQDLDRAGAIFFPLWELAGFTKGELPTAESLSRAASDFGAESIAGLLLLQSSFARKLGPWEMSTAAVALAEKLLLGRSPYFYLHLEKNCRALIFGELAEAVEQGLAGIRCAPSVSLRTSIKLNTLIAMEMLGLSGESLANEIESDLRKFEDQISPEARRDIASEIVSFRARASYFRGRVKEVFKDSGESGFYEHAELQLLVTQFPYHAYYEAHPNLEGLLNANPFRVRKQYKLNTILGRRGSGGEGDAFALPSWCDRLYIWTWRWLTNPEKFSLSALLEELLSQDLMKLDSKLTAGNLHMLSLCLSWLSLFDPPSRPRIRRLLRRFQSRAFAGYPLLEYEAMLIRRFDPRLGEEEREEIVRRMENHPIAKEEDIFLPLLARPPAVEGVNPAWVLDRLRQDLWRLIERPSENGRIRFEVDLRESTVFDRLSRSRSTSPALCTLISTIAGRSAVECEEVARVCLDVALYDPWVHQKRVSSLLVRAAKQFQGILQFKIRDGRILTEGDWNSIEILGRSLEHRRLADEPLWHEFLSRIPSLPRAEFQPSAGEFQAPAWSGAKTWREIHTLIRGKSRSTTLRQLRRWMDSGQIQMGGQGKATTYVCTSYRDAEL